ncbi:MAG TPA: tRNA-dihydrouridine synthase [Candidatus Paceibacterota bacterium]|nr:tRNA-dihydrouridine synthase [Candidatus Paceibacterota bacterium]
MSFWKQLKKPFFVMAPLADVTDPAFRALIAKCGRPDVFWTEFVSADGLYHMREIQKIPDAENPLMRDLQYSAAERPIVAQLFSSKPDMMAYAAELVAKLGFDGVDINMGCPDRGIERQGCGAAMIKTPEVAVQVIEAARKASGLPVSVKTRVGYNKESLDEWLPVLIETKLDALTLHLRTRKEMSLVPANWEYMKRAVEIRNRVSPGTLLIGNGDIKDVEDGRAKVLASGADGAMIGRGMFGNPWVFAGRKTEDTPLADKLAALLELAYGFEKLQPRKNFAILKKHIKAFVTGFDGAADFRAKLMQAETAQQLDTLVAEVLHTTAHNTTQKSYTAR